MPGTAKVVESVGSLGKNLSNSTSTLAKANVIGNTAKEVYKPFDNLNKQKNVSNAFGAATGTNN